MNRFFSVTVILLAMSVGAYSQVGAPSYGQTVNGKYRQHTGFYLSMSAGPVFGKISTDVISPNPGLVEFSGGSGAKFDLKIGGAVKENLILHGTIISSTLNGPVVKVGNQAGKASDNLTVGETMIGGGLTYYIMPSNIFLSGSAGIGRFTLLDTKDDTVNGSTDNGFSMQLKAGKEWWIGKRWGLGIALTYGKTVVHHGPYDGVEEKSNSNRFGILFNATFN